MKVSLQFTCCHSFWSFFQRLWYPPWSTHPYVTCGNDPHFYSCQIKKVMVRPLVSRIKASISASPCLASLDLRFHTTIPNSRFAAASGFPWLHIIPKSSYITISYVGFVYIYIYIYIRSEIEYTHWWHEELTRSRANLSSMNDEDEVQRHASQGPWSSTLLPCI